MFHKLDVRETLQTLLTNFKDLTTIPKSYSSFIISYISNCQIDDRTRKLFLESCKTTLKQWDIGDHDIDHEVVARCLDIYDLLTGKEYVLIDPPSDNLIIQDIDISNIQDKLTNERLEFDPVSGKQVENQLENLILEEVEVTDYVD